MKPLTQLEPHPLKLFVNAFITMPALLSALAAINGTMAWALWNSVSEHQIAWPQAWVICLSLELWHTSHK